MSNCTDQQLKSLTSFLGIIDLISWDMYYDCSVPVLPNVVILQAHELTMFSHRISSSRLEGWKRTVDPTKQYFVSHCMLCCATSSFLPPT